MVELVVGSRLQALRPAAARGAAVDADVGAAADGPPAAKRLRLDGNGAEEPGGSSLPGSPRGLRRSGSRAAPPPPVDAGAEAATYWNNRPRRQVRQRAGSVLTMRRLVLLPLGLPFRACMRPPRRTPVWAACAAALRRVLRCRPGTRSVVLSLKGRPSAHCGSCPRMRQRPRPVLLPGAPRRQGPCARARTRQSQSAAPARAQARAPAHRQGLHGGDDHQMVPAEEFGPGGQPFRVLVAPAAELMMDFHAHLSLSEVIGVLGGSWDAAARELRCARARAPLRAPRPQLCVSLYLMHRGCSSLAGMRPGAGCSAFTMREAAASTDAADAAQPVRGPEE